MNDTFKLFLLFFVVSIIIEMVDYFIKLKVVNENSRKLILTRFYLGIVFVLIVVLTYFIFFAHSDLANVIIIFATIDIFMYYGRYISLNK